MMKRFRIDMLPAQEGDCFWIEYGDPDHPWKLLVDGGKSGTYNAIRQRLESLPVDERHIELLIVSHVDADHIEGILKLLGDPDLGVSYGDIWFNGWRHLPGSDIEDFGPVQGERLTTLLDKEEQPWNKLFNKFAVSIPGHGSLPTYALKGGMKITLLSPSGDELKKLRPYWEKECIKAGLDPQRNPPPIIPPPGIEIFGPPDVESLVNLSFKADDSEANGSSIAVLAEFAGRCTLLAGDAYPDVLLSGIRRLPGLEEDDRLQLDVFKLPHHGSKANIHRDLLAKIDCSRYLFSTNGAIYKHPDREAVARVIKFGGESPELIFNYKTEFNLIWNNNQLIERYGYSVSYPDTNTTGQTIDLL